MDLVGRGRPAGCPPGRLGVGAPSWITAARRGCLSWRETGVAAEGAFNEAMSEPARDTTHTQSSRERGRGGTSKGDGATGAEPSEKLTLQGVNAGRKQKDAIDDDVF